MTALPTTVPLEENGRSVWPFLLRAESAAITSSAKYNDEGVAIRVLGFLLLDLWNHQGTSLGTTPYKLMLREVKSSLVTEHPIGGQEEQDEHNRKLYELGYIYRNNLFRVCM
jgi:hypothetical protein